MVTYSTQSEFSCSTRAVLSAKKKTINSLKESTRELKAMEFIHEWIYYKNSSSNNSNNKTTLTINNNNYKV
jgi:hypothetical protein